MYVPYTYNKVNAFTFKTINLCNESQTNWSVNWKTEAVCRSNETIQGVHRWVTCETGALTWGGIPEEETVPLGGRFLLVTEAQEKACRKCNKPRLLIMKTTDIQGNLSAENILLVHSWLLNVTKIQQDLQFKPFVDSNGTEQGVQLLLPLLKHAGLAQHPQLTASLALTILQCSVSSAQRKRVDARS